MSHPENSGNMVHGNAPLKMFNSTFFIKDYNYKAMGYANFNNFVNTKCSHLIITLANTLKLGEVDGSKYKRLLDFVTKVNKPIVVFGLGIQSINTNLEEATLPSEAIQLIKYLSIKSRYLGVRGEFTKKVVEKLCGISNAYVTGCPSIFSNPDAFKALRVNTRSLVGRPAFSGTKYSNDAENTLFINSIEKENWLIEPVSKFNHNFYLKILIDTDTYDDIPYFLKRNIRVKDYTKSHPIRKYFLSRYKLFRNIDDWYQFNTEAVSYTYGTRFHVNMASLISGKPALWLTHDARTRELVEFMNLPHLDINSDKLLDTGNIQNLISYERFFDLLPSLYNNFNYYLESNNLPKLTLSI